MREDVQEIEEARRLKLFSHKLTQNVAGGSVPSIFSMERSSFVRTTALFYKVNATTKIRYVRGKKYTYGLRILI